MNGKPKPFWFKNLSELPKIVSVGVSVVVLAGIIALYQGLPKRVESSEKKFVEITKRLEACEKNEAQLRNDFESQIKLLGKDMDLRDEKLSAFKERIDACCPYRNIDETLRLLNPSPGRNRRR